MPTKMISKNEWAEYFNNVSKTIGAKNIGIEISGLRLGDQVEISCLPLIGLTYDYKNDLLEVATESIDHMIRKPKEIHAEYTLDGLHSIEVVDADNNHQIIKFSEPLKLPIAHA
jgi:hypothetical protein